MTDEERAKSLFGGHDYGEGTRVWFDEAELTKALVEFAAAIRLDQKQKDAEICRKQGQKQGRYGDIVWTSPSSPEDCARAILDA